MVALSAIRELTVRGRSDGLDTLAVALGRVETATAGVGTVSETSARKQESLAKALERIEGRSNAAARAFQQSARDLLTYQRGYDQGAGSLSTFNSLLERTIQLGREAGKIGADTPMQQQIDALTGAGRAFENRGFTDARQWEQGFEGLERKASALRAEINPLGAAVDALNSELKEYRTLAAYGAISTEELAAASALAQDRFDKQAASLNGLNSPVIDFTKNVKAAETALRSLGTLSQPFIAQAAAIDAAQSKLRSLGQMAGETTAKLDEMHRTGAMAMMRMTGPVAPADPGLLASRTAAASSALSGMGAMSAPFAAQRQATERANNLMSSLGRLSTEVDKSGKTAGLAAHQWTNLSFQINDAATMALSGASAFQILATQGGQVYQVLQQGQGGIVGSLKNIGSSVAAFAATPAGIAAGIAGSLALVGAAYLTFDSQQRALEASLTGTGRATALTARQLNDLAVAAADAGGVSNATARELAGTFAHTGKIGADMFRDLIAGARDYAVMTGQELPQAADELARALADPRQGMDTLNSRLGFMNIRIRENIRNLLEQGDTLGAQRALWDAAEQSIEKADNRLSAFGRTWEAVKRITSNGWTAMFEGPSLDQEIATLQQKINGLEGGMAGGWMAGKRRQQLEQARRELEDLKRQQQEAQQQSQAAQSDTLSDRAGQISGRYLPSYRDDLSKLREDHARLEEAIKDTAVAALAGAEGMERYKTALAAIEDQIKGTEAAMKAYQTPAQQAASAFDLNMREIGARTTAQRAAVAADRAREAALRDVTKAAFANAEAERAAALVIEQARQMRIDADMDRALSVQERFASARLELEGANGSLAAIEKQRYALEAMAQARREAWQLDGTLAVSPERVRQIEAEAKAWGELQEAISRARLAQDLIFERQQQYRSEDERRVYSTMRSAGLLDENNEITGFYNQAMAAQIRLNAKVEEMQAQWRGVGQEMVGAWLNGETGLEQLANRIKSSIAENIGKQIDNGINSLISNAFPSLVPGMAKLGPLGSTAGNAMWVRLADGAGLAGLAGKVANDNTAAKVGRGPGIGSDAVAAGTTGDVLSVSRSYEGLNERRDTASISSILAASGTAQLDPTKQAWCAAYANAVLAQSGLSGTGSNLAASFQSWGKATATPALGDIVNLKPQAAGSSGHVGFFAGMQGGNVLVSGGNQSNGVNTTAFAASDVVSYRTATTEMTTAAQGLAKATSTAATNAGGFADGIGTAANQIVGGLGQAGAASGAVGGGGLGGLLTGILGFAGKIFGFSEGGFTGFGDKYEPAGLVHRKEYVFSEEATAAIGVSNLDAMHRAAKRGRGFATGGYGGGPVAVPVATGGGEPVQITIDVTGAQGNEEIQRMVAAGINQGIAAYDGRMRDGRVLQQRLKGANKRFGGR